MSDLSPPSPPAGLTGKQRQYLRGLAHPLNPLVRIGKEGLTEAIATKVRQELDSHELIKVKIGDGCLEAPKELYPLIAEQTHAELVQVIGKVGIFYKRRRKDPEIQLPK
jgi:RNA-binding protein